MMISMVIGRYRPPSSLGLENDLTHEVMDVKCYFIGVTLKPVTSHDLETPGQFLGSKGGWLVSLGWPPAWPLCCSCGVSH